MWEATKHAEFSIRKLHTDFPHLNNRTLTDQQIIDRIQICAIKPGEVTEEMIDYIAAVYLSLGCIPKRCLPKIK